MEIKTNSIKIEDDSVTFTTNELITNELISWIYEDVINNKPINLELDNNGSEFHIKNCLVMEWNLSASPGLSYKTEVKVSYDPIMDLVTIDNQLLKINKSIYNQVESAYWDPRKMTKEEFLSCMTAVML